MADHNHRGEWKSSLILLIFRFCWCCRSNITQCQTGANALNAILQISFTVQYPSECFTNSCRQNFIEETRQRIKQSDDRMTLPMRFNDGRTSETHLYLCSLILIGSSMYILRVESLRSSVNEILENALRLD